MLRRVGVGRRCHASEFSTGFGEQYLEQVVGHHTAHGVQPLPQHRLDISVIELRVRPHTLNDAGKFDPREERAVPRP